MNQEKKIRETFRAQAIPCRDLGSPFTARLCELLAERLEKGNAVGDAVLGWPGRSAGTGDALALRMTGALQALMIEGRAPELAAVYPPRHDVHDDDELWQVINDVCTRHAGFIVERLKSAPQTNEVRRASTLLPGFWQIARQTGLPLVLSELGASAGLNLHWDRFVYQLDGEKWGEPASNVRLSPEWKGRGVEPVPVSVLSRAGCDLNPLDPSSRDDMMRLMSYIWPDQAERIARTKAAIGIAASSGVRVEKSDAVDWLEKRLAQRFDNAVHVVFHTIAWQYFPTDARKKGHQMMQVAGKRASDDAPLAWLRFEMDGKAPGAALSLTLWPSGQEYFLGRADFHGRWVDLA